MIRIVFILFSIISIVKSTSAQGFEADIQFGLNAAQIDGDQFSGYSKLGLHGEIHVHYRLNDQWKLGSGISYDELGSQKELQFSSTPEEQVKIQLSYISVPFTILFQPESDNSFLSSLGFKGGLRVGYLLKSKIMDRTDEPILDFYSKTDFALNLGIRYDINQNWFFNLSAFESISLLFNNAKVSEINSNSLRQRNLTFSLGKRL